MAIFNDDEITAIIDDQARISNFRKKEFWKTSGAIILGNEELIQKWENFVDLTTEKNPKSGNALDESLQIMTMLKANLPYEQIKSALHCLPDKDLVVSILSGFVHQDIIKNIESAEIKR